MPMGEKYIANPSTKKLIFFIIMKQNNHVKSYKFLA